MLLYQNRFVSSFLNISSVSLAEGRICFSSAAVSVERTLPEMEVYKKWVAKSAAITALWCVLELNVKVPMKVRHVSEHKMRFSRKSLHLIVGACDQLEVPTV